MPLTREELFAKAAARKKLLAERAAAFAALPEEERLAIDAEAQRLRTAFGDNADWTVYETTMPKWGELPEENKENWRAVVRASK